MKKIKADQRTFRKKIAHNWLNWKDSYGDAYKMVVFLCITFALLAFDFLTFGKNIETKEVKELYFVLIRIYAGGIVIVGIHYFYLKGNFKIKPRSRQAGGRK